MDILRSAFDHDIGLEAMARQYNLQETKVQKLRTEFREVVLSDLNRQGVVIVDAPPESISGSTNHAVLLRGSRTSVGANEEEYWTGQMYMVERSNASLEYVSLGAREKMNSILDYEGFGSGASPPIQWSLSSVRKLGHLYPERMQQLVIVGPPFWMRSLMYIIKALLPKSTEDRIGVAKDR